VGKGVKEARKRFGDKWKRFCEEQFKEGKANWSGNGVFLYQEGDLESHACILMGPQTNADVRPFYSPESEKGPQGSFPSCFAARNTPGEQICELYLDSFDQRVTFSS